MNNKTRRHLGKRSIEMSQTAVCFYQGVVQAKGRRLKSLRFVLPLLFVQRAQGSLQIRSRKLQSMKCGMSCLSSS